MRHNEGRGVGCVCGGSGMWGVFEEGNRVERGVVFEKRRGGCRCGYIYIHVRGLK